MGQESNKIITIAIIVFVLGVSIYLNRKKIKRVFSRRVHRFNEKDAGFMKALAKEVRAGNLK